jgi:hypothetical protein
MTDHVSRPKIIKAKIIVFLFTFHGTILKLVSKAKEKSKRLTSEQFRVFHTTQKLNSFCFGKKAQNILICSDIFSSSSELLCL